MSKKLIVQILAVLPLLGAAQLQAKLESVTVFNHNTKPIFVKNSIASFSTGKSSIIDVNKSDSYDGMALDRRIIFRIFNNTSNSGPYLYVEVIYTGTIQVTEYDSSALFVTDSYTLIFPTYFNSCSNWGDYPCLSVEPANTKSGLIIKYISGPNPSQPCNATIFNDTSKEIFATNEDGSTQSVIQNNHNSLGFKAGKKIKIFNANSSSGAYLQLDVTQGIIYVTDFNENNESQKSYELSFPYGQGSGRTQNPYISVRNSTSSISGLEVSCL